MRIKAMIIPKVPVALLIKGFVLSRVPLFKLPGLVYLTLFWNRYLSGFLVNILL